MVSAPLLYPEEMMTTVEEKVCDGCGKSLMSGTGLHRRVRGCTIEIAPGCSVIICESKRYTRGGVWVDGCLIKAKAKKLVCPGCGGEYRYVIGVCRDCKAAIEKAKLNKTPMEKITIHQADFFRYIPSDYSRGESEYVQRLEIRLGEALVGVLMGPGTRRLECLGYGLRIVPSSGEAGRTTTANPCLEVAKSQADALDVLMKLLEEIYDRQRLEGRKEGRSLLVQLARGEMTVDELNERDKKLEEL
jgi:hypothetical protein